MTHPTSRNVAFFAATAFILAAGAFVPTAPAAAATSVAHTYCLTSDSENDCGFASLAQCEATASGGLGVCDVVQAWSRPQGATALDRFRVRSGEMSRR